MFWNKKKTPSIGYSQKVEAFHEKPRLEYLLPWAYIDQDTGIVHGKDHSMIAIYEFRGSDMDSSTPEEMMQYNAAINNSLKRLPTGYTLYFETQRHIDTSYEQASIDVPIVQKMEKDRCNYYQGKQHLVSSYYFVITCEPPQIMKQKITSAFIQDAVNKKQKTDLDMRVFFEAVEKFISDVNLIGNMLASLFPEVKPLSADEALTYLHSTISTNRISLQVNPERYITDYIIDCGLLGGEEMKLGDKFVKMITILDFPPMSTPGLFDTLNDLDLEYRWVSRFNCLSKEDADKELKKKRMAWNQQVKDFWTQVREAITKENMVDSINETAVNYREDASEAQQELGQDAVSYGFYTMTIMVMDEDQSVCLKKANSVLDRIHALRFDAYIEKDNSLEAWWGSIPGCHRANLRCNLINSLNFCHLAPVTAKWPGDKKNNHLKGPVLLYTDTMGSTPYRLSLHVRDVGHTLICGPTGSGKSVFLNTIEAYFLKYLNSNVFVFDKGASSRALTMAVGGNFYNVAAEETELSFQPLARIDDEKELKWAKEWILAYLKQKNMTITPVEEDYVWKALLSLKVYPPQERSLTAFKEMVQSQAIRQAISPLTKSGSYGKLFDNTVERSGNGRWQVFEMETLMATPAIVPLTLDYLFHRIEGQIRSAKGPSIIVLDEGWLYLDNEVFSQKLREYFKDMRKKNTSIILATQNLSDLASKPDLCMALMENCPNRIYLPNPNAKNEQNRELYKTFGCNSTQTNIIRDMIGQQDYYYSSIRGNRVFQLALRPVEYAFVAATSKADQIEMDRFLELHGDAIKSEEFIKHWLTYKGFPEEWNDFEKNYLAAAAE